MMRSRLGKIACILTVVSALTFVAEAQTLNTIFTFESTNGANSFAPLIQGTSGNLFGTTSSGGSGSAGTVFQISSAGTLTTLYNFCTALNCTDGQSPYAAVLQAGNGSFYGTTTGGGGGAIGGTVFAVSQQGKLSTIHDFCFAVPCTDGSQPNGELIEGADGFLYGTTLVGGTALSGTVYKMTLSGTAAILYNFCTLANCADGRAPKAGLVQGTNKNYFGVTTEGGTSSNCPYTYGCGTLFEITSGGVLTTLHNFCSSAGCPDGLNPGGTLIEGSDGNLYGTSYWGGNPSNGGTIFRFTPPGTFTTLYEFCTLANCSDGSHPTAGLIQGSDGNFYGTTVAGGTRGSGTAFQITPAGVLTTLHSFCSLSDCTDGGYPAGGLMQATNGLFYGTTESGGDTSVCYNGCGTVFSLSTGLSPFVAARPNFAAVGKPVNILGNNLTGTTSVTFNGIPATFTVVSGTFIKTTVPTGATTGPIQVTTPKGTLTSNVPFQVM